MINKLLPVKGNPSLYVHDNNDRIHNKRSSNLPDVFLLKRKIVEKTNAVNFYHLTTKIIDKKKKKLIYKKKKIINIYLLNFIFFESGFLHHWLFFASP